MKNKKQVFGWLVVLFLSLILSGCSKQADRTPTITPAASTPVQSIRFNSTAAATEPPTTNPVLAATATPPVVIQNPAPRTPTSTASPTEVPTPVSPTLVPTPIPSLQNSPTQIAARPSSTPSSATAANCTDAAAFVADVTIPDNTLFDPGATFVKTWRIRNEGTCTWGAGYALVFAYGDQMNGPLSSPLPVTAPGGIAEFSLTLTAPANGGVRAGNWQFQNDRSQRFGVGPAGNDYIWAQITVEYPTVVPTPGAGSGGGAGGGKSGGGGDGGTAGCAATRNNDYGAQVLALINNARTSRGLNALVLQDQLTEAAVAHSQDMACQNYVDHVGSDGSTWYTRVAAQGFANSASARENIYVGAPEFGGTPAGAFDWWMNSQVHRDNILNPDVTEIGIGYFYNASAQYGGYYTVVFARP